jgi:uncharacterized paraquat-inducible protein A
MAGSSLLRKVVTPCGFCLERWDPKKSFKSPTTKHTIIDEHQDEGERIQTLECSRCGTQIEWLPRRKMSKAMASLLKARYENNMMQIAKRERRCG